VDWKSEQHIYFLYFKTGGSMSAIGSNTTHVSHFPHLPEVVIAIFGFLPSQALHTASHVCSLWNRLMVIAGAEG
jgi:hypothetical protein